MVRTLEGLKSVEGVDSVITVDSELIETVMVLLVAKTTEHVCKHCRARDMLKVDLPKIEKAGDCSAKVDHQG